MAYTRSFTIWSQSEPNPSVNLSVITWPFLPSIFLIFYFLALCALFPCLGHAVPPPPPPICLWLTLPPGLIICSRDSFPNPQTKLYTPILSYASTSHNPFFIFTTCSASVFSARLPGLGSQGLSLLLAPYLQCLGHEAWTCDPTLWELNKFYFLSKWINSYYDNNHHGLKWGMYAPYIILYIYIMLLNHHSGPIITYNIYYYSYL